MSSMAIGCFHNNYPQPAYKYEKDMEYYKTSFFAIFYYIGRDPIGDRKKWNQDLDGV